MSAVHEVCSCGATFDYESHNRYSADSSCQFAANAWRKDHRHEPPLQPEPDLERHDTVLDAYVERPGTERDPTAEMDRRSDRTTPGLNTIGFRT